MIPVNQRPRQSRGKTEETRAHVDHGASGQAAKGQAHLLGLLADQQGELKALRQGVARLGRARSGGGFPWGLLLLAGGVSALYRFRPEVQHRVKSLLGQADPGVQGHLKRADGELRRAGEKTGDQLKDAVDNTQEGAKDQLDGSPR